MSGDVRFMKALKFSVVFLFVFASGSAFCEMLTLNNYLDMVVENNSKLKSIQADIDAVKGKLVIKTERVYSYSFSTGVNYDEPAKQPKQMTNFAYDASVNKQFAIGTQFALGLNGSSNVDDIAPFVKLQQSLWKDINGEFTKAGIAKAKASAKSYLYLLEYEKQKILLSAKLAYWDLSHARTVIDFRKISLERTKKILDWNSKLHSMDLTGKSDLLQSQAAVKEKELKLELSYEEENKFNRIFNQFLNIKDEKVKYDVEKFEEKKNNFKVDKVLSKKSTRADVLAALETVQSASYDQVLSRKSVGSDLVLNGQLVINNQTAKHTTKGDKQSYSVGLRYTLPLDFELIKTINQGYESAKISAQKSAEYTIVQENNEWLKLVDNWNNAKMRFAIIGEIEKIQQQRYEEDKRLLSNGRSTTDRLLKSEQDLDDAVLNVLEDILGLIKIYEQAEAFYNFKAESK
jgi:outer membrane protein TolC